jgi:hypothetical protein
MESKMYEQYSQDGKIKLILIFQMIFRPGSFLEMPLWLLLYRRSGGVISEWREKTLLKIHKTRGGIPVLTIRNNIMQRIGSILSVLHIRQLFQLYKSNSTG